MDYLQPNSIDFTLLAFKLMSNSLSNIDYDYYTLVDTTLMKYVGRVGDVVSLSTMSSTRRLLKAQLNILIVGGGIAGLAAAIALRKCGHQVQIFERSSFSNEIGAAVTISPNGTRVLREFGFDFKKVGGVAIKSQQTYDASTFEKIVERNWGEMERICGAPYEAMHRQDLHNELLRLALDNSNYDHETAFQLHRGVTIVRVDAENATIELDDGRIFSGDLLIGADGIHSKVRAAATGSASLPIDSEWQIYRFLLPRGEITQDPEMRNMKGENSRKVFEVLDPAVMYQARLIWYECRNGEVQNFAAFCRGMANQTKVEGIVDLSLQIHHIATNYSPDYGYPADKQKVIDLFKAFNPTLLHVIEKADKITHWRVYERIPLPTFVYYNRTILVGDAGHPMTPFTGQGATQALEDAGALLVLLSNIKSKAEVPRRLEMFNKIRVARASRIQVDASTPLNKGVNPLLALKQELYEKDELPEALRAADKSNERRIWDYKYNVFEKCEKILRVRESKL
ncbi:hypothetical protein G7Y89_g7841 [Cudoniella acicularis]|uniref:FAD-binding domain-containing protein n=1 Tax=Cudoniella acicularis TaxID=354080 RepID=A0A8H4RL98_9HELO|nr:hypothetical protein G7Y89_g7841 [Cudoniella acicularis]